MPPFIQTQVSSLLRSFTFLYPKMRYGKMKALVASMAERLSPGSFIWMKDVKMRPGVGTFCRVKTLPWVKWKHWRKGPASAAEGPRRFGATATATAHCGDAPPLTPFPGVVSRIPLSSRPHELLLLGVKQVQRPAKHWLCLAPEPWNNPTPFWIPLSFYCMLLSPLPWMLEESLIYPIMYSNFVLHIFWPHISAPCKTNSKWHIPRWFWGPWTNMTFQKGFMKMKYKAVLRLSSFLLYYPPLQYLIGMEAKDPLPSMLHVYTSFWIVPCPLAVATPSFSP